MQTVIVSVIRFDGQSSCWWPGTKDWQSPRSAVQRIIIVSFGPHTWHDLLPYFRLNFYRHSNKIKQTKYCETCTEGAGHAVNCTRHNNRIVAGGDKRIKSWKKALSHSVWLKFTSGYFDENKKRISRKLATKIEISENILPKFEDTDGRPAKKKETVICR